MQVVRKKLAVAQPTVMCEGFMYEEGPDLDEDEAEAFAAHLPKCLTDLPSGGIKDSSVVEVSDQSQQLSLSLLVTHQVHHVGCIRTPSCYSLGASTHQGHHDGCIRLESVKGMARLCKIKLRS